MKAVKKYLAVMMTIFMIAGVCPATVYASPKEGNVTEEIVDAEEAAPVPELDEEVDEAEVEIAEEVVGAGVQVGDGVTATYDINTLAVVFESSGGTLWRDWISKSGIKANRISSIRSTGTLYLPSNSSALFEKCTSLKTVDLSNFDTSNVTSTGCMFYECSNLTKLNLSKFDTSNVTNMAYMFFGCSSLTNLDLSSFNTSNVQTMELLFGDCSSLTNVNLSSFDTSNVYDMSGMFAGCSSLTHLDLSNINTSSLRSTYGMVRYCRNLKYLDLSSFDTSKMRDPYDMYIMFEDDTNLEVLRTPKKHRRSDVDLPITMYDKEGNAYTTLPVVENSIVLGKTQAIAQEYSVNDISECAITINPTSYTYDGTSKEPDVTVMDGTTTLALGTDYTVTYSKNKDAGTAVVTITATDTGNYEGTVTVDFTIEKADAGLGFGVKSIMKKLADADFTIPLMKATTAGATFTSDNTAVATVNSATGKVTIKGAGTATITASANANANYDAGSASYILIVEKTSQKLFSDVQNPGHAYYNAIYWAADAGITKGYPDGTFGINRNCTRGEMMMFLWRYAGKKEPTAVSKSPFKDVPKTHTFYKAILWGSQKGITKGYPDGTFGINKNVSRGECMMFLWRLKGKPAPKAVAKAPFPDVPKSHVFYNAVLWGYQKNITTGFTSGPLAGKFGVNENCSRGQIVTFLYRAKSL
ncbi:MAG: S-layer homology domain-containing protein [Lachnospiraceae bacterium]|nr:S-layer homology domain-containing protein [Lachnospiraceae bacterium]